MNREELEELIKQEYDEQEPSEEVFDQLREINRASLFKGIITPDYSKRIILDGHKISPFTKELKTSNITSRDLEIIKEISDMAMEWFRLGATKFAIDRFIGRDIWLSLAPSKDAALLKLMNTEYGIKHIKVDRPGRSFFRRGPPEGE